MLAPSIDIATENSLFAILLASKQARYTTTGKTSQNYSRLRMGNKRMAAISNTKRTTAKVIKQ